MPPTVAENGLLALIEEREARDAEADLRAFLRQSWPVLNPETRYTPNWHIDAICDHLMGVTVGHIRLLCINVPPRHTKSLSVSVSWPAWAWGPARKPHLRWLFTSYDLGLAIRDSVYTRRLIDSAWYRKRWGAVFSLTSDQNVKRRFDNDKAGFRLAGSFDAPPTGEGGDVIVADDPIAINDAENTKALEKAVEIWTGTMSTRLNDQRTGAKVIVMQRLNEADLAGHVLKDAGYTHLNLPCEFDPQRRCVSMGGVRPVAVARDEKGEPKVSYAPVEFTDPRTSEGELLWPARVGAKEVADLKKPTGLGLYKFEGQFNQNPAPRQGAIFKRDAWKFWKRLPLDERGRLAFDEVWQSWDCAFKDLSESDYVAGGVWGRLGLGAFYLIHQLHDRLTFTATVQAVQQMSASYPQAHRKLIEDKANGTAVLDTLKTKVAGLWPVNPEGGKVARANAVEPFQQAGNVWLPDPEGCEVPVVTVTTDDDGAERVEVSWRPYDASWVPEFIEECAKFPKGAHDDQVDQFTQALIYAVKKPAPRIRRL